MHNLGFGFVVFAFGPAFNCAVPTHLSQNGVQIVVGHFSREKKMFVLAVVRHQVATKLLHQ
jgi:hypothetical protein